MFRQHLLDDGRLTDGHGRVVNFKNTVVIMTSKSFLAQEGYDPVYGARPLRRAVQKHLMDPLARRLLDGSLRPGQAVTVDVTTPHTNGNPSGHDGACTLSFSAS